MKRASLPVVLPVMLLMLASGCASAETAPPPVAGGLISTLPLGTYSCEMAGDAGGLVGRPLPEYEFRVVNASAYKAGGIRGSYLLTGRYVTMTGGKLKGLKLHRLKDHVLAQGRSRRHRRRDALRAQFAALTANSPAARCSLFPAGTLLGPMGA